MRKLYVWLAGLMVVALLAQFFLAAVGAFDPAPKQESFEAHRVLGRLMFVSALLTTGVAALARAAGRLIGLTALVGGLVVIQSLIGVAAGAFDDGGGGTSTVGNVVFGLHAVNALIMIWLARTVFVRARQLAASPAGS